MIAASCRETVERKTILCLSWKQTNDLQANRLGDSQPPNGDSQHNIFFFSHNFQSASAAMKVPPFLIRHEKWKSLAINTLTGQNCRLNVVSRVLSFHRPHGHRTSQLLRNLPASLTPGKRQNLYFFFTFYAGCGSAQRTDLKRTDLPRRGNFSILCCAIHGQLASDTNEVIAS